MTKTSKPALIALAGNSGAGKDTLAGMLTAGYGYERFAFGDELRKLVIEQYGQLKADAKGERDNSYCELGSFKDAMVHVGGKLALSKPTILTDMLCEQLKRTAAKYTAQPVVVTDMRKPVEMHGLAKLADTYNLYFVQVLRQRSAEFPQKALDGLLAETCYAVYGAEQILQPSLPEFNGKILNDGEPAKMLHQLQRILELSLPYGPNQVLASDLYEWNGYH